jgi:D-alanyl-lipoteichoic acid acyltransferase DltB (MBOAT superfamily)
VAWGALHGIYLITSLVTKPLRERLAEASGLTRMPRLHAALRMVVVFALVNFAWIFFRANTMSDAMYIVSHLGVGWENVIQPGWLRSARVELGATDRYLAMTIGLIVFLSAAEYFHQNKHFGDVVGRHAWPLRWATYGLLVLAIINLGATKAEPFIYFQF